MAEDKSAELQAKYDAALAKHSEEVTALQAQHDEIAAKFSALSSEHGDVRSKYEELLSSHGGEGQDAEKHAALVAEHEALSAKLTETEAELEEARKAKSELTEAGALGDSKSAELAAEVRLAVRLLGTVSHCCS